jgi:polygalacturonase
MSRMVAAVAVVLLAVVVGVDGATLPRQLLNATSFTTNLLTAANANEARALLGLTGAATNDVTFNSDQFGNDAGTNKVLKPGALATNLTLKGTNYVTARGMSASRGIEDWLADSVNPYGQGAAGDGVTDDTTALQNAINLATSAGKRLELTSGTFMISAPLVITNTIEFVGLSWQKALIKALQGFSGTDDTAGWRGGDE